jgi:DNA-binding HxlR family transcriptional regulator
MAIGSVSARMLTARMKELETEQIVRCTVETSSPVMQEMKIGRLTRWPRN